MAVLLPTNLIHRAQAVSGVRQQKFFDISESFFLRNDTIRKRMAGEAILIVDDTLVNLKMTQMLLVNEGYEVRTAESAEEALEALRSFHPRLLLVDIQLPGMDGLELTQRVKQDARTRDIVVVALTAFATKGDEESALAAGCNGYITKPIDTRALRIRIRELLGGGVDEPPARRSLPASEIVPLQARFLDEGRQRCQQMLLDLDGNFSIDKAARSVHQWIGAGGLLDYPNLAAMAREVEAILAERPLDNSQLREALENLALAFARAVPRNIDG